MRAKMERMQALVVELDRAAYAYYNDTEIMPNFEYDKKYDELVVLEKETGVILSGSVTQKVGFEVVSTLEKSTHREKMLSLEKTKEVEALGEILEDEEGFLGWKEDGLTVVATYEGGELESAVTRGDGELGEDVTHNFKVMVNVPKKIDYKGKLVIRGEALITYEQFERINSEIEVEEDKYKNPRNLAAGSLRQLNSEIAKARGLRFVAFTVFEGLSDLTTHTDKLDAIVDMGFEIVEYKKVTKETYAEAIEYFRANVANYMYPTDGLVLSVNNIEECEAMGSTDKTPRYAMAFKWADATVETTFIEVDWSNSRTGAINPVGVFETVDLEGSSVSRASLSNLTILGDLELGEGDKVLVYKANMIIPQIAENLTRSNTVQIPTHCPVCAAETSIRVTKRPGSDRETKVLYCTNSECPAKQIGSLAHFVKRGYMNIDGMSEATIERLVQEGFISNFQDIYHLDNHAQAIVALEGWGKSSYKKLVDAIEKSRNVDLYAFIAALGVSQVGKTTSKLLCKAFGNDLEAILGATEDELFAIEGIGPETVKEFIAYFKDEKHANFVRGLASEMTFKVVAKVSTDSPIAGKTIVVTGKLEHYTRDSIKEVIESLGAKAGSGVSAKTDYLVTNDTGTGSSKNKKANELGVPIITEAEFKAMIE